MDVTDSLRRSVWFQIEETERHLRYYRPTKDACIKRKRNLENRRYLFGVTLIGITAIAEIAPEGPIWWVTFLAQVGAAVGLFHSFLASKHRRQAAIVQVLELVLARFEEVKGELVDLWRRIETYKVKEDEANAIFKQLIKWRESIDGFTDGYDMTLDEPLRDKSTLEAKEYMEGTFAKTV